MTGTGTCASTTVGQAIDAVYALFPSLADITDLVAPQKVPIPDGSRIHVFQTLSGGFAIVFDRGTGDCAPWCKDHQYWYFETDASCTVKQVGQYHPVVVHPPGESECLTIVGAPMWGTPGPYWSGSLCNDDKSARNVSGTFTVCATGYSAVCKLPSSPQKSFGAALQLVVAQTADLSKGTVTITGTGNPRVDGVALDATFERSTVRVDKALYSQSTKCIDEQFVRLTLDLAGELLPTQVLTISENRSAPACADGGAGPTPTCQAFTYLQLSPPVTPALCVPGVHQCIGNVSQTCDATGHWASGPTCATACVEGVCVD